MGFGRFFHVNFRENVMLFDAQVQIASAVKRLGKALKVADAGARQY